MGICENQHFLRLLNTALSSGKKTEKRCWTL